MKKIVLLFLLSSLLFTAQNQRFIYDYYFVRDTLNKTEVNKELMYLDITKEGSKFYSRDVFVKDSLLVAKYEKEIAATGSMNITGVVVPRNNALITYKVFKTYLAYNISIDTRIGADLYKVSEERKIEWKILPEKITIGEFTEQKTIATFGGRKWTAWFSAELPFQDVPYKFHGLPGLIVKMENESKTHQYELKGVTKFTSVKTKLSMFDSETVPMNISQEKYKKLFWELKDDPAKDFKQMRAKENISNMRDGNGSALSSSEFIKRKENTEKEKQGKKTTI